MGDRVCCVALNDYRILELWLAVSLIGAVFAPLNYRWSEDEIAAAVRDVGCVLLLLDRHHNGVTQAMPVQRALSDLGASTAVVGGSPASAHLSTERILSPGLSKLLRHCESVLPQEPPLSMMGIPLRSIERHRPVEQTSGRHSALLDLLNARLRFRRAPMDVALIVFTSGTTGRAKAAALTHCSVVFQSACKISRLALRSSDVYLHLPPLFHVGGLSSAHAALHSAATHIFLPRFSPSDVLAGIQAHAVTSIAVVPTMLSDLVDASRSPAAPSSLSCVRVALVGGGPLPPPLLSSCRRLFPCACFVTAYGMTEAASSISFGGDPVPHSPHDRLGQEAGARHAGLSVRDDEATALPSHTVDVGAPPAGIQVRVAAAGEGRQEGLGEIQVAGPNVMVGYVRAEGRMGGGALRVTDDGRSWDGWLRTGDLGVVRGDGRVLVAGRLKDVIRTGGENVHASEVEEALGRMSGVKEVAVFGTQDTRLGEAVAAVLVLEKGHQLLGEDKALIVQVVGEHCVREGLARFKRPRVVMAMTKPLPRNTMGKVDKTILSSALSITHSTGGAEE